LPVSDEIFERVVREGRRRRQRAVAFTFAVPATLALLIAGVVFATRPGSSSSQKVSVADSGSRRSTASSAPAESNPPASSSEPGAATFSSTTDPSASSSSDPLAGQCGAPGIATFASGTTGLGRLTVGGDGRVWFTAASTKTVGVVNTAGPPVTIGTIPVPDAGDATAYLPALGADGNVWFAEYPASTVRSVSPSGSFTSTTFADGVNAMTHGADGRLWYAYSDDTGGEGVAARDAAGTTQHFPVQSVAQENALITDIKGAPDGSVWFVEAGTNKIGVVKDGVMREFDGPAGRQGANIGPGSLAVAPDGVWFLALNADGTRLLGHLHGDGSITDTRTIQAADLAVAADGTVWFTTFANSLGELSPDGTISNYETAGPTHFVVIGPDGNPWFTTDTEIGTLRSTPCLTP
jgi:streptogramin lyase